MRHPLDSDKWINYLKFALQCRMASLNNDKAGSRTKVYRPLKNKAHY